MSKILYYFAFGKNGVNCFEKDSCTLEINLVKRKLTLKSLDKDTVLTNVTFDHLLQVKNHLYIFDLSQDNGIVIIFPEISICSRVFNILNEKKVQANADLDDLFKARFLKPFCQRYLASSSNEFKILMDEITSAFEGLKEEDVFLNLLLDQDQENRTVAGTVEPQASECSEAYSSSDDDDSDTISKSSDEGYTVPDDDSDSNFEIDKEISSNSNAQHEIIRTPLFEHCLSKQGNPVLMVYSSNEKSLFYRLSYDASHNYYRCHRCKSLGKYVSAILELDEDGSEIVVLRGGPHKCTLMNKESCINKRLKKVSKKIQRSRTEERARFGKNNRSIEVPLSVRNVKTPTSLKTRKRKNSFCASQSKIIRPPMYKKAATPAGNPKLLIFDASDSRNCYHYLYHSRNGHYFCSGCTKLKNWNVAELHNDSNGEEYVLLRNQSHICAPKLYTDGDTPTMMPRPRSLSILRNSRRRTLKPQDSDNDTSEEFNSPASKRARFSSKNVNDKDHSEDINTDERSPSLLAIIEPSQVPYPVQYENPEYVVKSGSFRFEQSKFSRIQNGSLLIADSCGLEYRYCYNRKKKEFICASCQNRFSHRVTAYWFQDINGEEFLRLGKQKLNHKCAQ